MNTPRVTRSKLGRLVNSVVHSVITPVQKKFRSFIVGNDAIPINLSETDEIQPDCSIPNQSIGIIQSSIDEEIMQPNKEDINSKENLSITEIHRHCHDEKASCITHRTSTPEIIDNLHEASEAPKPKRTYLKRKCKTSKTCKTSKLTQARRKKTVSSSKNGNMYPVPTKDQVHCYESCKLEGKANSSMTRCCTCMVWFHEECAQIDNKYSSHAWNCKHCSKSPKVVQEILNEVSKMKDELSSHINISTSYNQTLRELCEHNFLLTEQLNMQANEIRQLKLENTLLRDQVDEIRRNFEDTNDPANKINHGVIMTGSLPNERGETPQTQTKSPTNTGVLLMGDSTIKNVFSDKTNLDKKVIVTKDPTHFRIQDLTEAVRETTAQSVIIQCGADNVNKEKAHTTINRIKRLEVIIKNNSHIENVFISGHLPRSDTYDNNRKSELVNAAFKLLCEPNGWHFIDNSKADLSCLAEDGYRPNQTGVDILTGNIRNTLSHVLVSNQQDFVVHPRTKNP